MKLSRHALNMLIRGYSGIFRRNAVTNFQTRKSAKRKLLVMPFVAGLVLALSAGQAQAATTIDSTVKGTSDVSNYSGGNLTIAPDPDDDGFDQEAINGEKDSIEITVKSDGRESGDLTLEVGKNHGIISKLDENKYIHLSADGNITINVSGSNSDDDGDGISLNRDNEGELTLTAGGSNVINASSEHGDGIITNSSSSGSLSLTAESGNNKITAGNNGIDHKGSQIITVTAASGANIITGGVAEDTSGGNQGDGIRIEGTGSVEVEGLYNKISGFDEGLYVHSGSSSSGSITITANSTDDGGIGNLITGEDNGIQSDGSAGITVTASAGDNQIFGSGSAVYNHGSGTITITAGKITEDQNGLSVLADTDGYDNLLGVSGDGNGGYVYSENGLNSDGDGTTNVTASHDNTIFGTENGILSSGSGTINVSAENDNIIGQFQYEGADGKTAVETSETGINVEGGTVNITAGNENNIYAATDGISVSGEESALYLSGTANSIVVKSDSLKENRINGIFVENGGKAYVKSGDLSISVEKLTEVDLSAKDYIAGLNNYGSTFGSLDYNLGNVDIDVSLNSSAYTSTSTGIHVTTDAELSGNNSHYANASTYLKGEQISIKSTNVSGGAYGVHVNSSEQDAASEYGTSLDLIATGEDSATGSIYIEASNTGYGQGLANAVGVQLNGKAEATIKSENGNVVIIGSSTASDGYGVLVNGYANRASQLTISGVNTSISGSYAAVYAWGSTGSEQTSVDITATAGNNQFSGGTFGILSQNGASTTLSAVSGQNIIDAAYGIYTQNNTAGKSVIKLEALSNQILNSRGGIYSDNGSVSLIANGECGNYIEAQNYGIYATTSTVDLNAANGTNLINSETDYSIFASSATVSLDADKDNLLSGKNYTLAAGTGTISLAAGGSNSITSDALGIYAYSASDVDLIAEESNFINSNVDNADEDESAYGKSLAVKALSASSVTLAAENTNQLLGAVYAAGSGTDVFIGNAEEGDDGVISGYSASKQNTIYSYAYIDAAGDLEETNVISALYAEEGSSITLSGDANILRTYAVSESDDLERVVWAYQGNESGSGTSIEIYGYTDISTDNYDGSWNSKDIAVAAGTATDLEEIGADGIKNYNGERAEVLIEYADLEVTDDSGNTSYNKSKITGDILAAYAGTVNIQAADENSDSGIIIKGNLLAGNNGILNVDLGTGGILTGRADDYQDADVENGKATGEEEGFFNPAFSSSILASGTVNLTMGDSSVWYVTGQSWISSIITDAYEYDVEAEEPDAETFSSIPVIDLLSMYGTDSSEISIPEDGGYALTIGNMSGDAVFKMHLDGDNVSDGNMLYMKQANGTYYIDLAEAVSEEEINNGHDGLRFATVGIGSNVQFYVGSTDNGVFNVEYEVGTDEYATSTENDLYNGDKLNNSKPGTDTVDDLFDIDDSTETENASAEKTVNAASYGISLMSEDAQTSDSGNDNDGNAASESSDEVLNHKIIAVSGREISDPGKTILDMSRANYFNAIYLDTLNKRQGEARYTDPKQDDGIWVRMRHDNIGQEHEFRSKNTMLEIGYDYKLAFDASAWHVGAAIDIMHGKNDYKNVDGDGELDRYGAWLYGTWLADDGQYLDLVLKYGHLQNDFDVATSKGIVSGDYDNDVYSVSAEYGYKVSDEVSGLFFEPQAQLQYAYVSSADYTTSQGTKVDVESIDSLIGRLGFRAGADLAMDTMPTSLYFRVDFMHEFLGDQDISAYDDTGRLSTSYDNDETWYDFGLGVSVKAEEQTYLFLEAERVFGANFSDTYVFSAGFRHSF